MLDHPQLATSLRAGVTVGLALVMICPVPSAHASNNVHPRTPVLWPDADCIQTVDRSVDPSFAFSYEIPGEDTQLSFDELEDSRRHQFIGFCRQWPAGRPPPRYISLYDLQRSVDAELEQAELLDDPESTLETSEVWSGCWTRITADDDRRPITYAAAATPVVWDTLDPVAVEPGTWLVAGYTWEPPYNLWRRAPWVVRVIDEPAPAEPVQAAVSIGDTADYLHGDEIVELPICVDATAGSTLSLEWAASKPELLEWAAIEQLDLDIAGPADLLVPFSPPEASLGLTIVLRAVVEQPAGDAYVGHALDTVIVFGPGAGDGDGDDSGDGDGDGDGEGTPDETETTGGSETGPGGADGEPGAGHCSLDPARGSILEYLAVFGVCALLSRRRRERQVRTHERQHDPPCSRRSPPCSPCDGPGLASDHTRGLGLQGRRRR
ncbi:hypothetical protein [Enhygromyxa salina]|uniref:Uncharacterized protein n=1 Tax=Enhygromyxa salina TaxID=215803 RepID=A0A2S9Y1Y4_9BACT|nr:hypothetical protein [Enhygromyxa salina]PRP99041.1 hypothetical protein ENSA7_64250 [Enhygromyxa salina]